MWIFDKTTSRVNKQTVNVKHIENELAIIEGDISLGQRVVSAGATKMTADMKVLPYKGEK